MIEAGLALGSNEGDSRCLLADAVSRLKATDGIEVSAVSDAYQTPPWGKTDQADFLNACLTIRTNLSPQELLDVCQRIEAALGRKRDVRWGPRTLDMDILWYGDIDLQTEHLTIPHSRMLDRGFVMIPLAAIAPDHLVEGVRISEHAKAFQNEDIVSVGPFVDFIERGAALPTKTHPIQSGDPEIKGVEPK
ncbi:MAG: 2-amino-4-hydroxy-6-hydroxymethyldihydropteridine diphosphokinase [Pseudomonadota bacterium]